MIYSISHFKLRKKRFMPLYLFINFHRNEPASKIHHHNSEREFFFVSHWRLLCLSYAYNSSLSIHHIRSPHFPSIHTKTFIFILETSLLSSYSSCQCLSLLTVNIFLETLENWKTEGSFLVVCAPTHFDRGNSSNRKRAGTFQGRSNREERW